MFEYGDKNIELLIEGIYSGKITQYELPEALYNAIANYFKKGLYQGFGMSLADAKGKDFELLAELRENIYLFSAAKTFQEVKEISSLMIGDNGELRTVKEFNEVGRAAFEQWNNVWGTTEYNTAVGQAQSASKWLEIEANKAILPMLKYSAVLDANTSEICAPLDGMVAPVDDPIWNTISPLNHFGCRCVLLQEDDSVKATSGNDEKVKDVEGNMNDLFKMNPGKDKYVFSEDHPYFQVDKKDRDFARDNFGLPIPEKDAALKQILISEESKLPKEFKEWGITVNSDVNKLLERPFTARQGTKGSYVTPSKNEMTLDMGQRWKDSKVFQKKVVYHEMGHIIHEQNGLIKFGSSVSEEYSKHFSELKKLVVDASEVDNSLSKIVRDYTSTDNEGRAAMNKKYGCENRADLINTVGSTSDSLMALTNSRYGSGHTKSYMKLTGAKEAEMFAHSMENHFEGNPVFKEVMPDVYEKSKSFIKSLIEKK